MLAKIEILEKEIKELREQLVVGKEDPRATGQDILAEVVDRAKRGEIPGTLCVACAEKLVEAGFKFCAANTTSRGIQTEKLGSCYTKTYRERC